ncbi:MAG TPA: dUTP diphosphatase [Balneola sp.]|nr:dUTP diphosphatase [Balneola sp.]
MKVNVKRIHPKAVIPTYSMDGDAAMDLTATSRIERFLYDDKQGDYIEYGTGLAIEIPDGHVGLLFPRSSISKMALTLANSVGVIDSNYRGEVKLRFKDAFKGRNYNIGDRVGQILILPYPKIELTEVDELSNTTRGSGGFGSTGN